MKKLILFLFLFLAATLSPSLIAALAQDSTTPWPYFVDVTLTDRASAIYDFLVPLEVMDKSPEDLADLRLYDSNGKEIPYAIRIRREVNDQRLMGVSIFNRAIIGSASEVSVDLGENGGEHNEIEVETGGVNFRRRVDVEGSTTGNDWRTLKTGGVIFGFKAQNGSARLSRISYPSSRYRYLRVRVFPDEMTDKAPPAITDVKVLMVVRERGEPVTWNTAVPAYQLLRNQGAPASAWTIDLGARVPVTRLLLEVIDESFSRPFQLESVDDPQNIRLLASGELTRRSGEEPHPLVVNLDNEEFVRKVRLVITDYNNQTLSISEIKAEAAARQLIFELKDTNGQPLRLYFGNAKAAAPHYDFEKELPAKLALVSGMPARSEVGFVVNNPDYKPEPLPLTERIPWLIYLVLAASSIALALILVSLARTALEKKPKPTERPEVGARNGAV
jgi:hypothetical protein